MDEVFPFPIPKAKALAVHLARGRYTKVHNGSPSKGSTKKHALATMSSHGCAKERKSHRGGKYMGIPIDDST